MPAGNVEPVGDRGETAPFAKKTGKPVIASWMGGSDMAQGVQVLNRAGIPTFPYPDTAARVFQYMWRYSDNLRALYETPVLHESAEAGLTAQVRNLSCSARVKLEGHYSRSLSRSSCLPRMEYRL